MLTNFTKKSAHIFLNSKQQDNIFQYFDVTVRYKPIRKLGHILSEIKISCPPTLSKCVDKTKIKRQCLNIK